MSDILDPQGLEPNEALQDADVQGVYQPTSGGIRRNKQASLLTYKTYYQKLTTFTPNNIIESDGTGNPRTTGIATSAVSQAITDTNTNTNDIAANINQGVKTTDTPTFADATIGGHAIDAELSTLNNRVNQGVKTTDTPTFAKVNTGHGATEIHLMNQNIRTTDSPTFEDVTITGMTGTVESRIEGNASDIVAVNGRVDGNDTDIATLGGRITSNDNDITNLQNNVNQGVKTTDNPTFESVNTGHGANDLYPMNQPVRTTDAVTFDSVNTGLGDTNVFLMNQNIRTIDPVTFESVNTGHGANDLYPMNQPVRTTDAVTFDSVNTGNVSIKNKLITGVVGSGGIITVAHGINKDKILDVSAQYENVDWFNVSGATGIPGYRMDATNITYTFGDSGSTGFNYRMIISYEA